MTRLATPWVRGVSREPAVRAAGRSRGSRRSRRPSPRRLIESTVEARKTPGTGAARTRAEVGAGLRHDVAPARDLGRRAGAEERERRLDEHRRRADVGGLHDQRRAACSAARGGAGSAAGRPSATEASTNGCSRSVRTTLRTSRTTRGICGIAMARMHDADAAPGERDRRRSRGGGRGSPSCRPSRRITIASSAPQETGDEADGQPDHRGTASATLTRRRARSGPRRASGCRSRGRSCRCRTSARSDGGRRRCAGLEPDRVDGAEPGRQDRDERDHGDQRAARARPSDGGARTRQRPQRSPARSGLRRPRRRAGRPGSASGPQRCRHQ